MVSCEPDSQTFSAYLYPVLAVSPEHVACGVHSDHCMKYCYADYNIHNACIHFSQVHSLHAYRHVIHKCVFNILYERKTTLRLSVKAAFSSYHYKKTQSFILFISWDRVFETLSLVKITANLCMLMCCWITIHYSVVPF